MENMIIEFENTFYVPNGHIKGKRKKKVCDNFLKIIIMCTRKD